MKSWKSFSSNKMTSFAVALTIFLNVYGAVLSKNYGIPSAVFTAIPLMLLFGCVCAFHNSKIRIDKNLKIFLIFNVVIFGIHLIFYGMGSNEIKYFLYICTFFVSLEIASEDGWKTIEDVLILVSLLLSLDALRYVPAMLAKGFRIYNVTSSTLLDKAVYTLVLTLTVVLLLVKLFENKSTQGKLKKTLYVILIIAYSVVNIVVVQSKLFVMTLCSTILILYFFSQGKSKKKVRSFVVVVAIGLIVLFYAFPDKIPDYIYVFLNRYTGAFGEKISTIQAYNKYTVTYEMRNTIYNYALGLFFKHPVFGIGFGNYQLYAKQNATLLGGVTQTESSMMSLLVEGGILYVIMHAWLLIDMMLNLLRKCKEDTRDMRSLKMIVIIIAYLILNAGNDCFNVMYWMILGFIYKFSRRTYYENECYATDTDLY